MLIELCTTKVINSVDLQEVHEILILNKENVANLRFLLQITLT